MFAERLRSAFDDEVICREPNAICRKMRRCFFVPVPESSKTETYLRRCLGVFDVRPQSCKGESPSAPSRRRTWHASAGLRGQKNIRALAASHFVLDVRAPKAKIRRRRFSVRLKRVDSCAIAPCMGARRISRPVFCPNPGGSTQNRIGGRRFKRSERLCRVFLLIISFIKESALGAARAAVFQL